MAVTLTFIYPLKAVSGYADIGLYDLINQRTLYFSDQINKQNNDIAELVPLTLDDFDFIKQNIFNGAVDIFTRIGAYSRLLDDDVEAYEEEYEYVSDEPEDAVVYRVVLKDEQKKKLIEMPVLRAIEAALIRYVVAEWLKLKNVDPQWKIEMSEYMDKVNSAISYLAIGDRTKIPVRNF
jgi:hypothetical protein